MKITRILHASVNHADRIDETVAFYRDTLGMSEDWRPDLGIPGQWLDAGNAQVHLVGFASGEGSIDPSRHHVCFGVTDLDAATAELTAAGIEWLAGEQDHRGVIVRQIFCTDPAGNTIELQEDAD